MTTAYSNLLGLALPVTGELSGTWGDTVNDYITKYLDDAIANAQIISGSQTAVTLSKTTGSSLVSAGSGATGSAQYALIRCTGNPASTLTITVSYSSLTNAQFSKTYLIFNSTSTSQSVVVQATTSSGTSTGVTITSGEKALIAWNGTDFVKIATQSGTGEFVTVDTTNLEVTNIKAKDGTAAATIADSTGAITVSTILNVDNLRLDTNTISSTDTNGNIVLAPNGNGDVQLDADTVRVGDSNVNVTITSNGTADLILNTNAGTNSGSITIADGANGNITIATNGTGVTELTTAVTMSATTQNIALGTSQTSGTFTVGGAAQTGTQTFDQSTKAHTLNIGTGATESAATKTINIGTGGVATSTTAIAIGSTSGSTTTLNGTVNLNAGTINGVAFVNGSKVLTTGSALTFDGFGSLALSNGNSGGTNEFSVTNTNTTGYAALAIKNTGASGKTYEAGVGGNGTAGNYQNNFYIRDVTGNATFALNLNNIIFIPGGTTEVARFTSTGLKSSIAGTNADPVFSYTSDTNTGIFFPAADKLGFTAGGGSDQMVLTSTGLGIGTNNPAQKLDVVGAAAGVLIKDTQAYSYGTSGSKLYFQGLDSSSANTTFAYLQGSPQNGNADRGFLNVYTRVNGVATQTLQIGTGLNGDVLIPSGNLGLGVTPSAWGGAKSFESGLVGNYFIGSTAASYTSIGTAAYYNGTNWIYARSTGASKYELLNNTHAWFNAASGTAGNLISFTQAMTLDALGNLVVGGTSANVGTWNKAITLNTASGNASYELTVAGAAKGFFAADASNVYLQSSGAIPLIFTTNGGERARITSGGYFKAASLNASYINSSGSYHEFNVNVADDTVRIRNESTSTPYGIDINFSGAAPDNNTQYFLQARDNASGGTTRCIIYSDGDLANHDGVYGTISDQKLKQDIVDAGSQWDDIKAIRFRKYRMKSDVAANPDAPALLGVVAQELEQVSPGLVDEHPDMETVEVTDEDGNVTQTQQPTGTTTKTVKSSILLMKAAVALQEAMARIEKLEAEVAALKGA